MTDLGPPLILLAFSCILQLKAQVDVHGLDSSIAKHGVS